MGSYPTNIVLVIVFPFSGAELRIEEVRETDHRNFTSKCPRSTASLAPQTLRKRSATQDVGHKA
jgi:hypothetical protein